MAYRFSRRTLLRGMWQGTVASVALPLLEGFLDGHGNAYADGTPLPVRFILGFWGCGVRLEHWVPRRVGAGYDTPAELQPYRDHGVLDYLSVVSGTSIRITRPGTPPHHVGTGAVLTGGPVDVIGGNSSATHYTAMAYPTVDQVVAQAVGDQTPFRSVQIGISEDVERVEGPTAQFLSHNGPNSPNPAITSPAALYRLLFGVLPLQPSHKSILDLVNEDIRRLQKRVSTADARRLDAYYTNIRSIEKGIGRPAASCASPDEVTDSYARTATGEQLEARSEAMWALLSVAFACDLTRVAAVQFTSAIPQTVFSSLGLTGPLHGLTHRPPTPEMLEQLHQTIVFTQTRFARLLASLKSQADGMGNVLDNTVAYLTSDLQDAVTHSNDDYPILVAGRAGGFLKYPGVHYRSPNGENTTNVLLTVLRAAGVRVETFGYGNSVSSTRLAAIEA
ncbi:MAG TPA: DUF1552 domain-containing protein [Myxococcota bacterium]|nr:DUF1552 domain-containing protein [Myxococcota bacterium]